MSASFMAVARAWGRLWGLWLQLSLFALLSFTFARVVDHELITATELTPMIWNVIMSGLIGLYWVRFSQCENMAMVPIHARIQRFVVLGIFMPIVGIFSVLMFSIGGQSWMHSVSGAMIVVSVPYMFHVVSIPVLQQILIFTLMLGSLIVWQVKTRSSLHQAEWDGAIIVACGIVWLCIWYNRLCSWWHPTSAVQMDLAEWTASSWKQQSAKCNTNIFATAFAHFRAMTSPLFLVSIMSIGCMVGLVTIITGAEREAYLGITISAIVSVPLVLNLITMSSIQGAQLAVLRMQGMHRSRAAMAVLVAMIGRHLGLAGCAITGVGSVWLAHAAATGGGILCNLPWWSWPGGMLAMLASTSIAVMIYMTVPRKFGGLLLAIAVLYLGFACLHEVQFSVLQTGLWPVVIVLVSTGLVAGLIYAAWHRLALMDLP